MADHLVTSQTGCRTSLFKTSDISALGRAPYPPNTGLGPEKALHTLVTSLKCMSTLVLDP